MRLAHATAMIMALALALCGGCEAFGTDEVLRSRVEVDRERLVRGERLTITVTVFSGVAGGTLLGSGSCPTGFSVLDRSGSTVAPLDVVCTADLSPTPVPGEGLARQFTWRGRSGLEAGGDPLPPGVYRIIGGAGPPGALREGVSDPVTIELVEP